MICKNAGPQLVPFGDWGQELPEQADMAVTAGSNPVQALPGDTAQIMVPVANDGPQDDSETTVTHDLSAELGLASKNPG